MRSFYHAPTNTIFTEATLGPILVAKEWTEEAREAGMPIEFGQNPAWDDLPEGAIEISAQQLGHLIAGQSDGRKLVAGNDGLPTLTRLKVFFDPASGGFYNEDVHGSIERPVWQSEAEMFGGVAPTWETNPDCVIPAGAVEITPEWYAKLIAETSKGKIIVADDDGQPCAVERVPSPEELLAARRSLRQGRLAASDWTSLPDTLIDQPQLKAAWAAYRQQLRDLDMAGTDWPLAPGEKAEA